MCSYTSTLSNLKLHAKIFSRKKVDFLLFSCCQTGLFLFPFHQQSHFQPFSLECSPFTQAKAVKHEHSSIILLISITVMPSLSWIRTVNTGNNFLFLTFSALFPVRNPSCLSAAAVLGGAHTSAVLPCRVCQVHHPQHLLLWLLLEQLWSAGVFFLFLPLTFKRIFKSYYLNLSRNSFTWEMCNSNLLTQLLKALLYVFLENLALALESC